jgi:hypothetical protein
VKNSTLVAAALAARALRAVCSTAVRGVSTCDRIGVKGRGAVAWLSAAGVVLPSQPNRLLERPDGLTVAPRQPLRQGFGFGRRPAPALQPRAPVEESGRLAIGAGFVAGQQRRHG